MKKLRSSLGYSVIELLVAAVLTGIVSMAGFRFYVQVHNQTIAQDEISDMQQRSRAALEEISKTLRMAGYKVGSHDAYHINNDTLYVFFSDTQPIDTVVFYLSRYSSYSVSEDDVPTPIYNLMMKRNSETPAIYADNITSIEYDLIDASSMEVVLQVQAGKPDETFDENGGIRTFTNSEIITMRNLTY